MNQTVEKTTPYGESTRKSRQIEDAFNKIAPHYDFMNRLLSAGIDSSWRRKAILGLPPSTTSVLDIATGTGDQAFILAGALPHAEIVAVDFSETMLTVARKKAQKKNLNGRITFLMADGLQLPFDDNRFDVAVISFGLRNFENLLEGCKEALRTLKPRGELIILELSRPEKRAWAAAHHLYLTKIMPWLGRLFAGSPDEYRYLQQSVNCVPQGENMLKLLSDAGFCNCRSETYTLGACSCYRACKPEKRVI